MTKKCVQCNKPFNISDSEIEFYESKNLSLPKRCKECRDKNKNAGSSGKAKRPAQTYKSYYAKKDNSSALGVVILAVITALVGFILKNNALEKVMENVVSVDPLDGKVFLTDLLGEQKIVDGRIKEIRLMDHKIILSEE